MEELRQDKSDILRALEAPHYDTSSRAALIGASSVSIGKDWVKDFERKWVVNLIEHKNRCTKIRQASLMAYDVSRNLVRSMQLGFVLISKPPDRSAQWQGLLPCFVDAPSVPWKLRGMFWGVDPCKFSNIWVQQVEKRSVYMWISGRSFYSLLSHRVHLCSFMHTKVYMESTRSCGS